MDAAMQYSAAQFLVEGTGVNALLSTYLQPIRLAEFCFGWFLFCTRRVLIGDPADKARHTFSAFWL